MNAKRVVNFLILRSAFTQRNMTSLLLVGIFFAVYVLSGGKVTVTKLPNIKAGESFGSVTASDEAADPRAAIGAPRDAASQPAAADEGEEMTPERSQAVLGIKPTEDQEARQAQILKRGRLLDSEPGLEAETDIADESKLVGGADFTNYREEFKLKKAEKRKVDKLSAIEDRLKASRR